MTSASTPPPLRLGLIGVDSPHAPSFTRLFGDGVTGAVPGATVTAAWKGVAAADFPLGGDRVDALAREVTELGVPLCSTPDEVAERCDALLIVAADARTHPGYFTRLAPFGKPVYVDTRFALALRDARAMLATARRHACLPLAGSPKRFTPEFRQALGSGDVDRLDLTGPLPTQPGHPFLAWYGVHLVDLAVAALGPECVEVDATDAGRTKLTWADGRIATLGGDTEWSPLTTGHVNGRGGGPTFAIEAGPAMLTGLLTSIVESCRTGVPNVPGSEVLAIVAIVEAAHRSRSAGAPVTIPRRPEEALP
ncbi:putative dehydrogenase [Streptomyces sp. 840.1]|uniref:Gfo/Idh/MocA family protein n=1 Tax=Streptomyces sp. 840.1 TaxID=2485152 RepID=UPI000F466E89|nr:gfo/Idh/MocA family oxidoreductase [Streptomyces sp. 840.1]ROQ59770.1 putative dehydrogenase [Streptomyces sp. 840.1]